LGLLSCVSRGCRCSVRTALQACKPLWFTSMTALTVCSACAGHEARAFAPEKPSGFFHGRVAFLWAAATLALVSFKIAVFTLILGSTACGVALRLLGVA